MKIAAHSAGFLKKTRGFHPNYTKLNILFYRDSVSISGLKFFSDILFSTAPQIILMSQEYIRKPGTVHFIIPKGTCFAAYISYLKTF